MPNFEFDEMKSNDLINNLDFIFITSTDVLDKRIINLGQFNSTVIIEKATIQTLPNIVEFEEEPRNGKLSVTTIKLIQRDEESARRFQERRAERRRAREERKSREERAEHKEKRGFAFWKK